MICIPIIAQDTAGACEKIAAANPWADILEIRIDAMDVRDTFDMGKMRAHAKKPIIATCRSPKEGGLGALDERMRKVALLQAVEAGVDFVDVEFSMPEYHRRQIIENRAGAEVIVSAHVMERTPEEKTLHNLFDKMCALDPDIIKIVTRAHAPEDNLRVLGLIPLAKKANMKIIALCMGPMGKISRIAAPLLGGYLTFAALEKGQESAAGQIPVQEMQKIFELIK